MELLTAYQTALAEYSAAIQTLHSARGPSEHVGLAKKAMESHAKCEEARQAVVNHRMDENEKAEPEI
jgi:hypothetical protein